MASSSHCIGPCTAACSSDVGRRTFVGEVDDAATCARPSKTQIRRHRRMNAAEHTVVGLEAEVARLKLHISDQSVKHEQDIAALMEQNRIENAEQLAKISSLETKVAGLKGKRTADRLRNLIVLGDIRQERRARGEDSSDEGDADFVGSSSDDSFCYEGEESEVESCCSGSGEEELDDNGLVETDGKYKTVQHFAGLYVGMPFGMGHVTEIWPGIDKFMVTLESQSGITEILPFSISKDATRMMEVDGYSDEELALVDPHASHRGLPYLTNGDIQDLKVVSKSHARLVVDSQLAVPFEGDREQ